MSSASMRDKRRARRTVKRDDWSILPTDFTYRAMSMLNDRLDCEEQSNRRDTVNLKGVNVSREIEWGNSLTSFRRRILRCWIGLSRFSHIINEMTGERSFARDNFIGVHDDDRLSRETKVENLSSLYWWSPTVNSSSISTLSMKKSLRAARDFIVQIFKTSYLINTP